MIQSGTLSHFTVHFTEKVTKDTKLVVKKNGTATAAECTVKNTETTCSDNTDTVAFAASDLIAVEATYSGSNSGTNPSWNATYP